ncbi:hypothetical protein [Micromonospora sp. WMMD1082]|uniref:hypothetical protein n=1 Tax=Micromonospora sp. WMMD1082 TaxID=3016104 RepID=UPI00241657D5|nr:hypothetical protein [Micromonospora sp. WMMD1082]MDG4795219.1 hypothetical protein [Micromonospora sp. WMMD1082]
MTVWAETGPQVEVRLIDAWQELLRRYPMLPTEDDAGRAVGQLTNIAAAVDTLVDQSGSHLDSAGPAGRRLKSDMTDLVRQCRAAADRCRDADIRGEADSHHDIVRSVREDLTAVLQRCRRRQGIR